MRNILCKIESVLTSGFHSGEKWVWSVEMYFIVFGSDSISAETAHEGVYLPLSSIKFL